MLISNKVKIFADIYLDSNKNNPSFRLKLDLQNSRITNEKVNLKFTPMQESFIFHGFRGINSRVELCLVAPHFNNDKRTKTIEKTSELYQQRGKSYHLANLDSSLRIKMTIVSRRQLEILGGLMGTGKDSLLVDTSRNIMNHSHAGARAEANNVAVTDRALRQSITSVANVNISEVQELNWDVNIDKLYHYFLNDTDPLLLPIQQQAAANQNQPVDAVQIEDNDSDYETNTDASVEYDSEYEDYDNDNDTNSIQPEENNPEENNPDFSDLTLNNSSK